MPKNEPEIRRGVTLTTRGGSARATADCFFLPRSEAEAVRAVEAVRRSVPDGTRGALTLAGTERSFEAHFLPCEHAAPSAASGNVTPRSVLSSRRLRGGVRVLGETTTPRGEPALRVRALAGTSFGELLRSVRHGGVEAMPFSCPTAEAISLGGALAVNTHSRTSATYGGLFAEHVRRFTLIGADGRRYDCHAEAETSLERRLFRYVPGALGALGFVTEMELELARIPADTVVVTEVLASRAADPAASVMSYLDHAAADARSHSFSEGFALVFFGTPERGRGVVLGRRRLRPGERRPATLPLFRESAELNLLVQLFAHRYPGVARTLAARLVGSRRNFCAPYQRWAFFQSSYDDGAERFSRRSRETGQADFPTHLGLVHQGWVLTGTALLPFLELAIGLFALPEFEPVAAALEFFDVGPLPAAKNPLDPSRALGGGSDFYDRHAGTHVLTLSIAVRDTRLRELGVAFCHALSEAAFARGLDVVVQLNKQHHVTTATLRAMHETALGELRALRTELDPYGFIGSRTLERLGV